MLKGFGWWRIVSRFGPWRDGRLFTAICRLLYAVELRFADFVFWIFLPAPIGNSMSHVSISSSFVSGNHRL